jgi:hypothetical protein
LKYANCSYCGIEDTVTCCLFCDSYSKCCYKFSLNKYMIRNVWYGWNFVKDWCLKLLQKNKEKLKILIKNVKKRGEMMK